MTDYRSELTIYVPKGGDTRVRPRVEDYLEEDPYYRHLLDRGGTLVLSDHDSPWTAPVPGEPLKGQIKGVPVDADYDFHLSGLGPDEAVLAYRRTGRLRVYPSNSAGDVLLKADHLEAAQQERDPDMALYKLARRLRKPNPGYDVGPLRVDAYLTFWPFQVRKLVSANFDLEEGDGGGGSR